jgi:hypothetical protein
MLISASCQRASLSNRRVTIGSFSFAVAAVARSIAARLAIGPVRHSAFRFVLRYGQ